MKVRRHSTGLAIFVSAVARAPERSAICYFDAALSYRHLDAMSDALAARLLEGGFSRGDRLAIYLQNMPHFVVGLLAAWKIGGICVPVNPMNREREVAQIFADCRPKALLCLDELFTSVVRNLDVSSIPEILIRVTATEFQTRFDARVCRPAEASRTSDVTLLSSLEIAVPPRRASLDGSDIALLVYTSGTTGLPKGAMITHAAYAFNSEAFCEVAQLNDGEPVLGIAPLFHITGSVACLGSAMVMAAPLVLTYRFEAGVVLDAIREWRPTFVVAAITAFIAIYNHPEATRVGLGSLEKIYSGGAAVPASFVAQFEARFGRYIHNCYGLTETAAPTHIVPWNERAPVSHLGGALSMGRAAPGVTARLVDDDGATLAAGVPGELVIEGPMVSPGYWQNPLETASSMRPDGFRTGDVAFRDTKGWFYLVDRKKDMIISSGYKVWPREVEDVLYTHPAIREAAVVGVVDEYRGETVKAIVSLKPGQSVDPRELVEFCRMRMAAYKYPRSVEIRDELPKTGTGKILRRELR
jgi:long-chain acyl-CoA synthetase